MDDVKEVNIADDQQALILELSSLISDKKGINEALGKQLRKRADEMITAAQKGNSELDIAFCNEITSLLSTLRDKTHKQVERRDTDFQRVMTMLDQADQALKQNELKTAETSVHNLLSILGTIPGLSDQRRQKIDKRLNRIQPQMHKLESWRHWGTSQARTDLISQIKLLVGSRLHPKEIAKTIDDARTQWQNWDKGGDHTKKELWLEFDHACKEAFKPCKIYFDERKTARKDALNEKRAIIEEIKNRFEVTDWKSPDYKDIDKWLRAKRRDFFKTESVDYKHRKKIIQSLDETVALFESHLGRERTRCYKTRQKLIEEVTALEAMEDSKAAMEQLEAIKKRWIVTVIEKRGLEDKLWKQYQTACDVIYNKRKSARKEQDAQLEQNFKSKNGLIEELSQIASLEPTQMLAERSKFLQLLDQYKEIGYVPRKHEKSVQSRFNQARKQFEKNVTTGEQVAHQKKLNDQYLFACLCHDIEQAVIAQKGTVKLIKRGLSLIDETQLPESLVARFSVAQKASDESGFNKAELVNNLELKQNCCLKLEVCYDLDSPAEFQKQRMAYQIERLSASMKKNLSSQDQPEQLIEILLSSGAVPNDHAESIATRITTCFNRHIQS